MTGYRDPLLEERIDGTWQAVDQSVHGRDFWQTDYDADTGSWDITYSVPRDTVDDVPVRTEFRFFVAHSRVPGGNQIPGDVNQDGDLTIVDAMTLLFILFGGDPFVFPCGAGDPEHASNVSLADWQPDNQINLADAVMSLEYLYLAGAAHPLGIPGRESTSCVVIDDCPQGPGCR